MTMKIFQYLANVHLYCIIKFIGVYLAFKSYEELIIYSTLAIPL
jgi:hypothetical protein